jgi:hypothetical protein
LRAQGRWRKSDDPKARRRAAVKAAADARKAKPAALGPAVSIDKNRAESTVEAGLPASKRLYRSLEFRGKCVRSKEGKFPCPTKGFLLEQGVSTDFLEKRPFPLFRFGRLKFSVGTQRLDHAMLSRRCTPWSTTDAPPSSIRLPQPN